MSKVYDDWERLVFATLDREHLRQLARASSIDTSFTTTSASKSRFNFKFHSVLHHNPGVSYFIKATELADELVRVSDNSTASFKDQCLEINSKARRVALLLREATTVSLIHGLYHSPARHITGAMENVLKKAISLVHKCRRGIKRFFMAIPQSSFQDISFQLECSIANISWLLRDDMHQGVPPIAADDPVRCNIWELNAILHTGSVEDRCDAAISLLSLANQSEVYRQLIIAEGHWIHPLLRLLQEGTLDVQETAAMIITLLGKQDSRMIDATVSEVFREIQKGTPTVQENAVMIITLLGKQDSRVISAKVSKLFQGILWQDSPSKLQGTVAWAISELVEIHAINDIQVFHEFHFIQCLSRLVIKTLQDDETDDCIAEATTRAIWHLAKRSWKSFRIIAKYVELTRLVSFLGIGEEARDNSAMALLKVTGEAERDVELRKSLFNPKSPAYKAVVDELIRVIQDHDANSNILIPSGNLSTTFVAEQMRMIAPLAQLLEFGFNVEPEVANVVCAILSKLINPDNYHHVEYSKKIFSAGGASHLVNLVQDGEKIVQTSALILLCYVSINLPQNRRCCSCRCAQCAGMGSQTGLMDPRNT